MRSKLLLLLCVPLLLAGAGAYWYFTQETFDPEPAHKDKVETNAKPASEQFEPTFIDSKGEKVDLAEFRGKKNVLLVFMRGFPGEVCINCSAQTSRLIKFHPDFVKRDTEVLVVFPGPKDTLPQFLAAGRAKANNAEVPFRILMDPDFAAVDRLGIRGSLAKPSTYLLDKQGKVRFAYVGAYTGDRPSIQAMFDQIDRLQADGEAK